MQIKIYNHKDSIRYIANNGKYQINMETIGEKKMSEDQFKELANEYFNMKED